MPLLSPVFREINYQRISSLNDKGYQPATIASIISDETGEKILTPDVRGYLKLQKAGSARMLVTKKGLNEIKEPPAGREAA